MNAKPPKDWTTPSRKDTIASVAVLATAVLIVMSTAVSNLYDTWTPATQEARTAEIVRA